MEEPPGKVCTNAGQKDVPCRTSGQLKDNITAFLVQNTFGEKLPLYPILRGDTTANRPGYHTKKQNSSIRQDSRKLLTAKEHSVSLNVSGDGRVCNSG